MTLHVLHGIVCLSQVMRGCELDSTWCVYMCMALFVCVKLCVGVSRTVRGVCMCACVYVMLQNIMACEAYCSVYDIVTLCTLCVVVCMECDGTTLCCMCMCSSIYA